MLLGFIDYRLLHLSFYIVGSTDMIPYPFAEGADPEFYLFSNGSWGELGGVSKIVNADTSKPEPARNNIHFLGLHELITL